jgi:hypothetical protein
MTRQEQLVALCRDVTTLNKTGGGPEVTEAYDYAVGNLAWFVIKNVKHITIAPRPPKKKKPDD